MAEQNASSSTPSVDPELDRREYFRVEDHLILRYRRVSPDVVGNMPAEQHFDNSDVFGLLRELRQIDQEYNNALRGLAEQNRELGTYLKSMNRKIELVANALATLDETQQKQSPQRVSISESGIAFRVDNTLAPGDYVALELILLPNHTGLALYGEVLANRSDTAGLTAVAFVRLRESDRQVLARHILHVQIAAKKQNRTDSVEPH